MRIDSKTLIANVPILKVRKFFRRHQLIEWRPELLQDELGLSSREAHALFDALLDLKYIQPSDSGGGWYRINLNGAAFAAATASLPLTRRAADRKLAELLERIRAVNANMEFLYWIPRAIVFGSYLSDKERISDIDVAVELRRKVEDGDQYMEALWRRVDVAEAAGRRFGSYSDKLGWPETEVIKFLQNRSRAISLIMIDNPVLKHAKTTRVYDFCLEARYQVRLKQATDVVGEARVGEPNSETYTCPMCKRPTDKPGVCGPTCAAHALSQTRSE